MRLLYLIVVCVLATARFAQTPSAVSTTSGPAHGSLLIVGGGAMGPELWQKFVDLAGGANARIVVIPTANEDDSIRNDRTADRLKALGVKEVTVLHTRDPKEADTEKFTLPLKTATGVWFGGGRQWRLADSYLNTRTQTELNAVLARGGVIGGSSAGATIQGSFLVRGDTKGNEAVIGDHTVGLGFLKNAAIDQHVLRRNRQFDLIPLVEAHPELLGIGIDESTGIVVQGEQFEVVGVSYVAVYDANEWQRTKANTPGIKTFRFLGKGQHFDLKTRRIVTPSR